MEEFGGGEIFSSNGEFIICRLCRTQTRGWKRAFIERHCNTKKHKASVALLEQEVNKVPSTSLSSRKSTFFRDVCEMMVGANIPFHKVENVFFKNFIEKYTEKQLPSESTLRKNYLPDCYADVLNQIRKAVGNNKIWVSVDETTDETGRFVAHVVVGTLSPDGPGEKFLLTAEVLDKVNHASIVTLFENSMSLLWPDGVKRENILLLVTDGAAYMMKAGRQIKLSYPNICHMTCLAHCLHRVAETVRSSYPDVDRFISNMKKIFLKAPTRLQVFKNIAPEIPLPPKPIITRWGTWLDAASYYAKYYEKIVDVLAVLNSEDCSSVAIAKELVSEQLRDHIMYIEQKFKDLSKYIKLLETSAMEISKSLKVVQDLSTALDQVREGPAQAVTQKLKTIIDKNVGYSDLCQIRDQLASTENQTHNSDSEYIQYFKFAPVTSCDVERSFSRLKSVLTIEKVFNSKTFECT